jgi:hypothetical protein
MRWHVAVIMLLIACGCSSSPPPIKGRSALRVRIVAQPKAGYAFDVDSDDDVYGGGTSMGLSSSGAFARVDYHKLKNVVIWVKPVNDNAAVTAPDAVIKLTGKPDAKKIPVIATGIGGRIVLHNDSGQRQDVYGLHDIQNTNITLGEINPGEQRAVVVNQPGVYSIFSDLYDQPIATLFVAPAVHVAVGRSGRNITFANLLPGQYTVACWHPRLPGSRQIVELRPDTTKTVSLKVSVNTLAASR